MPDDQDNDLLHNDLLRHIHECCYSFRRDHLCPSCLEGGLGGGLAAAMTETTTYGSGHASVWSAQCILCGGTFETDPFNWIG